MSASPATMKAAVIYEAGGPEVLKIEARPIPRAKAGQVLIAVKAFGLNRSELFTRQGSFESLEERRSLPSYLHLLLCPPSVVP